jgi:hypothetical protein
MFFFKGFIIHSNKVSPFLNITKTFIQLKQHSYMDAQEYIGSNKHWRTTNNLSAEYL